MRATGSALALGPPWYLPGHAGMTMLLQEASASTYQTKANKILQSNNHMEDVAVRRALTALRTVRTSLVSDLLQVTDEDGFRAAHLRALQAAVDLAASNLELRLGTALTQTLDEGWQQAVSDTLSLVADSHLLPITVSVDQLAIAQQVGADLVRGVSADFRAKARQRISMGVLGTRPAFAVMQDVQALLQSEPGRQASRLGSIAYQAERIVRTETNGIYNLAAQVKQQQVAEVTPGIQKYWLAAHDERTRQAHAEADAKYGPGGDPGPIPFDATYMVGGEPMRFPHDPNSSARNRVNCRCVSILYNPEWFS